MLARAGGDESLAERSFAQAKAFAAAALGAPANRRAVEQDLPDVVAAATLGLTSRGEAE
jgi:hypothetical protein